MVGRICLLFDGFDQGGIGRVNLILASAFLEAGLRVDLLVLRSDGPRREEVPPGARVIDLRAAGNIRLAVKLLRYIRSAPDLNGFIASNVMLAPHVGLAARLSGRLGLPILCVHHVDMRRSAAGFVGLKGFIRRWSVAVANAVFGVKLAAVSIGAKGSVVECLRLKSEVIDVVGNPVHLSLPGEPISSETLRWWKDGGSRAILAVGRITPEKDFETLIEAVDSLRSQLDPRLIIVGFGPHSTEIERLIQSRDLSTNVRLVGFVGDPRKYYEEAEVLVSSSLSEALPLSLIEALSVGTQVVSTDCDYGPREILQGGSFGRLVPNSDPDALAEAVLSALHAPMPSEVLRERARQFSPERIADVYLVKLGISLVDATMVLRN